MFIKKVYDYIYYKAYYLINSKSFAFLAPSARVQKLLRIEGKQNISIGNNVIIQRLTWLAAVPLTGAHKCKLTIGDGTIIGHFNHIYATGEIIIGKNVLTADKVYIADNQHNYEDINVPVLKQSIKQFPAITIGDGTWLGENVCVIGVSIGKNCVIGANSVVNRPLPDYCVAVGSPARIIKKYNFQSKEWEKI
ncbi:DapH/DapD/GlmU-related protein [Pedobacter foliorum]|uniref:acyltransferase n=1 Tax=Pedobacter foliorum TaxID=2739058 RepID=UPI00156720E1|nr:acyltransferase [Pedobacter foliorum]NRF39156.1 acyltransferase [Pedobacter foliorum]